MAKAAEGLRWGSYKQYEGPYHLGLGKLGLQVFPTDGHRLLDVVTQTEGGSPSAVNAYDRCIISLGLLQWCEAKYFLSSNLLGALAERDPALLAPLRSCLTEAGATFKQKASGKWRFFIGDDEVDSADEQQRLFFAGANGLRGQWQAEQKAYAQRWVVGFVDTLAQPAAIDAQVEFTAKRMYGFADKASRAILFDDGQPLKGWPGAVQAGFLSFAANLPAVASQHLQLAVGALTAPKWSPDWCIGVLKQLTFGPKITIYPQRYDKIRPKLEQHFAVNLPDFAAELKTWEAELNQEHDTPVAAEPTFLTIEDIQRFLVDQGFDLGSSGPKADGVDGQEGRKTRDAVMTFQRLNGLSADGKVGKGTRAKMLAVYRSSAADRPRSP